MGSATRLCCFRFVLLWWEPCCSLFVASRLAHKAEHAVDLIGCRQMPASLRDDSSLADPSLAFGALNRGSECSENGGPSCPIVSTSDSSPNGSTQEGALQTFLQRRKKPGAVRLCRSQRPTGLWHLEPSRSFASKARLRGITHKAESNSNCLGQATVVLVRWTFQPVAALIVRHVSSGHVDISDNVFHFRGKGTFGQMVWTCTRGKKGGSLARPAVAPPQARRARPAGIRRALGELAGLVSPIPRACGRGQY